MDTEHHVITHIHAYHADKKDSQCLPGILKELKENLEPEGLIVEQILADTGYSSGTALKALEQNNITGYIPNFGQYKYARAGFTYHKEGDYYQCPQNKKLVFKKIKDNNGYPMREYRSSRKDCVDCPLRSSCICIQYQKDDEVQHQPTDGSSSKADHRIGLHNKLIHFSLENSIARIGK